jgi:hypothetical protein
LIRGRHGYYVESKDPDRIRQRPELYILEVDPMVGPGWRKEGKRVPKVFVVRKECQLAGKGGER